MLQGWGVNVGSDYVKDPDSTITGQDVIVRKFGQHPVVNSLAQLSLQMILPRPIGRVDSQNPPASAPQVDELAFSGPSSTLAGDTAEPPRSYPLMVAVEKKSVAGVASPRGNTRITRLFLTCTSMCEPRPSWAAMEGRWINSQLRAE